VQHKVLSGLALALTITSAACASDPTATRDPLSSIPTGAGSGVLNAGTTATVTTSTAGVGLQGTAGVFAPPPVTGVAGKPAVPPPVAAGVGGPVTGLAGVGAPVVPPATGAAGKAGGGAMPVPVAVGGGTPKIPMPKGECPKMVSGPATVMGATVQLFVGPKSADNKGPIMVYWHGTGGNAATATIELSPTAVSEIMASGGIIISMESGGKGNPVDWGVFTTGDYEIVDQLVACAVQQLNIDTHRIYTGGASAGGLAAGTMAFARSSYLAAANPNSGGVAPWPGLATLQDPTNVPSSMTMHGAMGVDQVVIDFGVASMDMDKALVAKGGFAVDCDHGGAHTIVPSDLREAGWVFLKAHPFGTKPSPYAGGLPATFPKYCTIVK